MNVPPIWRAVVEAHERELAMQIEGTAAGFGAFYEMWKSARKEREPSLPFPLRYARIEQQVHELISIANGRNSQEP